MSMWLRVALALLLVSGSVPAQTSGVVDEGSFTLTRGGSPFGTESFKIVRRLGAGGVELVAQCTRTLEGRVIRTSLTTDSAGNPSLYTRATTGAGRGQLTARRAMNRLTINEDGPQASSKDYVFAPGTLILDDDVIHQLFFVDWGNLGELKYVVPASRTTGQGALTEVGRENVVIGNATIPAMRYSLGSGDSRREIWIDSSKRVLKVAFPARQLVGTRDLPPR